MKMTKATLEQKVKEYANGLKCSSLLTSTAGNKGKK
jgi:hypothetical protein